MLPVVGLGQGPARLAQQHVDEQVAGLCLGVVVVVDGGAGSLTGRHLLAQARDLGVLRGGEVVALGELLRVRLVLRHEPGGEAHHLLAGERSGARGDGGVEDRARRDGLRVVGVVESRPHHDVVELPHDGESGVPRDRLGGVHRGVADLADEAQLGGDAVPGAARELGVADAGGEVVTVGRRQREQVEEVADHCSTARRL